MSAKLRGNICKPEECETIKMSAEAIDKRDKKIQALSDALDVAEKALEDNKSLWFLCKDILNRVDDSEGKVRFMDLHKPEEINKEALQKIAEVRDGE